MVRDRPVRTRLNGHVGERRRSENQARSHASEPGYDALALRADRSVNATCGSSLGLQRVRSPRSVALGVLVAFGALLGVSCGDQTLDSASAPSGSKEDETTTTVAAGERASRIILPALEGFSLSDVSKQAMSARSGVVSIPANVTDEELQKLLEAAPPQEMEPSASTDIQILSLSDTRKSPEVRVITATLTHVDRSEEYLLAVFDDPALIAEAGKASPATVVEVNENQRDFRARWYDGANLITIIGNDVSEAEMTTIVENVKVEA